MKFSIVLGSLLSLGFSTWGQTPGSGSIVWRLNNLERIGDRNPLILGEPVLIDTSAGKAIQFDGKGDALVLDLNPLAGCSSFTLEVVFRPDPDGSPEQRFVHLEEVDDHRVLIETRLTQDGHWFLDTFLKSGEAERTLYAKKFLHPTGEWFHAALTYENGLMRHYVNGIQEMEGVVDFLPMTGGKTSLGSRLNRVYWYKGAIREVSFTAKALPPPEFVLKRRQEP